MKKLNTFWSFLMVTIGILTLHSCSISTTNHYYPDKKMSFATDMDMSQALEMMKGIMPDSLKQDADFMKMENYPKEWRTLYDIQKEEGKNITNPDSIKLMKKIFLKGNFADEKFSGFSVKSDALSKEEIASIGTLMGKDGSLMNNAAFNDWDGKTLKIDTKKMMLSEEELQNIFRTGDKADGADKEQIESMLGMIQISFDNKLVFDKKIKSIKGQHDWIRKLDDKTVGITLNLQEMMDKNHQFKNKDEIILVETE